MARWRAAPLPLFLALCLCCGANAATDRSTTAALKTGDAAVSAPMDAAATHGVSPLAPAEAVAASSDFDDEPPSDPLTGKPRTLQPLDPAAAYQPGEDVAVILRRSDCYGSCPVYSVGIQGDGSVHFYGQRFTATLRYAADKIDRARVASLLAFLGARQFHALHGRYLRHATDHPTVTTILRRGRQVKVVEHDESNDSEPRLPAIEQEIDRVAGASRWIGAVPPAGGRGPAVTPPPIPSVAFERMLRGMQSARIERACAPPGGTKLTLPFAFTIDDLGFGEASASGLSVSPGGVDSIKAVECVQTKARELVFPLASISTPQTATLVLGR
jgi:hypothetical protein